MNSHRVSGQEQKVRGREVFVLLSLAHHFSDGMTNDCARLFGLFFGEASRDTHLEGWWDNLLGFEVVLKSLQPGDHDTIGKGLQQS